MISFDMLITSYEIEQQQLQQLQQKKQKTKNKNNKKIILRNTILNNQQQCKVFLEIKLKTRTYWLIQGKENKKNIKNKESK